MAKTYNQKIDRNTAWGGDLSTSGLPVAGNRVQEFIKDEFKLKAGAFLKPSGGNFVYCFATKEDRDLYIETENESLIIDRFETESNYNVYINQDTLVLSKSVIEGSTGNTIEFQFKITDKNGIVSDSKASITFTFLAAGNVKKYTTEVQVKSEGWTTVVSDIIDEYLKNGENNITITISGLSSKTSSQFVMTYNVFDLEFYSTFKYNESKPGNTLQVPYYIKCTETKYLEYYIDGVEVNTDESQVINDAVKDGIGTINITNLSLGQHTLQVRAYVKANDGTKFYSDTYYYTFAKSGNASPSFLMMMKLDNTQAIALNGNVLNINVSQFEQVTFEWSIYDYLSRKFTVVFEFDNKILSKNVFDINGTINEFSFRPFEYGENKILRIYSLGENEEVLFENIITFNVKGSDNGLKETTDGLLLKLSAMGRRNTDEDKDVWSCVGADLNTYSATFNNFVWSPQQGWNADYESLVISNGAYVDFNIRPMINHWEENGGTFEIDLETFDIEDEDALICECQSHIEGKSTSYFKITATNAEFSTADGKKINTRYKDNERLKIAFIGNKKGTHEDGNLIYIMVNGVLERAALYTNTDKIYSDEYLRIGSEDSKCKIRLHSIRVYNRAISVDEEFNNFVVDSDDSQIIYESNNIFKKGTNEVGFDEIANKIPVMIFTGDMNDLVKNGQDKQWRYFDVEYVNRQEPERNFVSFNCQMKLQGTSSLGYPRKNFKLKTKDKLATKEYYNSSNYILDTEESEVGNRRLRNKTTGKLIDFGDFTGNCFTFGNFSKDNPLNGELLKKGKYKFKENAHKADKWTLKADYMESSCSHNIGAGRSWNDIFENTELKISNYAGYVNNTYRDSALVNRNDEYDEYTKDGISYKINLNTDKFKSQKDFVCRTDAQKICWAEDAEDIRTAVDGFPMVCFYRTSHSENNLVFMGQYNFINDKGSYEVFGFEDIESPKEDDVMIYDSSNVECWEGLKNTNPISLFKTTEGWNGVDGWKSTFESRYPDPDDEGVEGKRQVDASALYELCKWLVSTRHENDTVYSGTLNIDSNFAKRINGYQYAYVTGQEGNYEYASGEGLEDNAENRQKKFETEKWEHFDVWKLAGYYIYLMRYGAVDQFVKNTMLFTDGNGRYDPREDKKYRKWFYINYDNDCLFGLRNNGELAFHWKLDRTTLDNANDIIIDENDEYTEDNVNTYAMMGHDSTLWNNLEADDEFMRMVRDLDDSMNKCGLNYDNMVTEFDTNQTEKWCERVYNANERYKYIYSAKGIGDMQDNPVDNLWMLQGTRRSHRHWWIANHFNMLDARWLSGDYKNTYVQIKTDASAGSVINAVAGDDYYFAWGQQKKIYESNIQKRKGDPLSFVFTTDQVQGDPVYIYAYNKMSELDFSGIANKIAVGSFEFNEGGLDVVNTLKKLVIGNPNVVNRISLPTTTWSKLGNLEYLDITNYAQITEIPFESLPNLHTFKAGGSGIASFAPVEGSTFDYVELSNAITTIILNDIYFENVNDNFVYTPTTNLSHLELRSVSGVKMNYFRKLVEPWLNAMASSVSSDALYANATLILDNVDWQFTSFDEILLFEKISKTVGANFVISGVIDLTPIGSVSMSNINKIKEIFGENCFNNVMSSIYVKVPETIFIHTNKDSMVAGKTNVFYREIYPAENALVFDHKITYHIVEECEKTTHGAYQDAITNKYYVIVDDISSIRNGNISFIDSIDDIGREIGVLSSNEVETGGNTNLKIMCRLIMGGVTKISVCDFTILEPTYANSVSVRGDKSLYKNREYIFEAVLKNGLYTPIGTENVEWTVTMNDKETYLAKCENVDEHGIRFRIVTSSNEPSAVNISEAITLSVHVTHGNGGTPLDATYTTMLLNNNVILTSESNPIVMAKCYAAGFATNNVAMTKQQAAEVTDISTVFSNITQDPFTFNEFRFFTGITSIPEGAFSNSKITDITIPSTVESIGDSAFSMCRNLAKISTTKEGTTDIIIENTLPNIVCINERTFDGCELLQKLRLPNSIIEIKNFAFGGTGFKKVLLSTADLVDGVLLLPNEIQTIQGSAFESVKWNSLSSSNNLTVFSVPSTLSLESNTEILCGKHYTEYIAEEGNSDYISENGVLYSTQNGVDKYALVKYPANKNKDTDENVYLDGIMKIYDYAFLYCNHIGTVVLPNTLLNYNFGANCFEQCSVKVVDISAAEGLNIIPDSCFRDCPELTDVIMPTDSSIKKIGAYAFYNCPSLTGLTIPNGVQELGYYNIDDNAGRNFHNCGFTALTLPDTIVTNGKYSISNCVNLVYLKLPKLMKLNINNFVNGCSNLETVVFPLFSYYDSVTYNVYDGEDNLVGIYDNKVIAISEMETNYPDGHVETVYGNNVIVNSDFDYEFISGSRKLKTFLLNDADNGQIALIYDGCLYDVRTNKLLKVPTTKSSVMFIENIAGIGAGGFYECMNITNIVLPDSVTSVGRYAFRLCQSLENVTIKNVSAIPFGCFSECVNLVKVILGEHVTAIDGISFGGCDRLSEIYLPTKNAPTLGAVTYAHPFGASHGGGFNSYTGIRSDVENKIYIPYNAVGYDSNEWLHPLTDSDKCNFTINDFVINGELHITIYDENGEQITSPSNIYCKSETGVFDGIDGYGIGQFVNGYYVVYANGDLYHGETLTFYSDSSCENSFGEIVVDFFTVEYTITKEVVFGDSVPKRGFDNEEYVTLTKSEYETIMSNLKFLNKIVTGGNFVKK